MPLSRFKISKPNLDNEKLEKKFEEFPLLKKSSLKKVNEFQNLNNEEIQNYKSLSFSWKSKILNLKFDNVKNFKKFFPAFNIDELILKIKKAHAIKIIKKRNKIKKKTISLMRNKNK